MMLIMRFLLPLMLVLASCWASEPILHVASQATQQLDYRLPSTVVPTEYDITLAPTFESEQENKTFTFEGWSKITLDIKKLTNIITFHAKELSIGNNTEITLEYDVEMNKIINKEPSVWYDTQKDFVHLIFKEPIPPINNATLSLHYTGKLNDELRGFYRSSYQNKDGKTRWLATTHFEPVSARQAFPCWDEPELKAKFVITINVLEINNYTAISNMPDNTGPLGKNGKITFMETPKMSTYLVAFVVSDFAALQNKAKNFRVFAKPTIEESAKQFAYDYGLKTLEVLNEFTNINYNATISKMDQIAIPDFGAGAMENWGLVTYREPQLFYIKEKSTTEKMQAVATTIAHEFSHQWFGNLVTCKWWNDIWLNEGFATFFQYYITDKVVPKMYEKQNWRLMEQFVVKNVQALSFVVDASSKTRPLKPKIPVQTSTQIRSLFDDIAYRKGASILHMMQGFLSEEVFQTGLRKYLTDHTEKAVDSDDLFNSIHSVLNETLVEKYLPNNKTKLVDVMKNWVNEPGYPVITVIWNKTLIGVVNIKQERFFLVKPAIEDKTQWYIPLTYVTENSPEDKKSHWMIPGTDGTSIENLNNASWILFNKDQKGYYRVNYDDINWQRLATALETKNHANISAINRAQLIDDALNLARAGRVKYDIALQMTNYLSSETDYIPWYAAVRAFDYLDSVLLGTKKYPEYHKYVADQINSFATKVNYKDWKNGTHVEKLAKVLALNTACKYGLDDCTNFAKQKLTDWLNDKDEKKQADENADDKKKDTSLSPDMRKGIICAGLRNADMETWDKALEKYKGNGDKDEKADLLAGLGCATSKEIVQKFLTLTTVEKEPEVDIFAAMNSIFAGNAESFDILVEFINKNVEKIQKADKEDNSMLAALLNNLSNRVVTVEQYAQLSLLVHGQLKKTENVQALSVGVFRLTWIQTYQAEVEKWIANNCKVCQKEKPDSASSITVATFLLIISLLITRFY